MSVIHFLNVLEGDCNIIQHDSGRVSVIDVSNADDGEDTEAEKAKKASDGRTKMYSMAVPSGRKNYGRKGYPDNPISYLKNGLSVDSVFRFIITHPDMDHLDGIADFFNSLTITNVWDTDNNKEIANFKGGGYNKEDWEFYKKIRNGKEANRKTYYATNSFQFFNEDYLTVLSPTKELIADANKCGDWNDSSYVLLYTPPKQGGGFWKILFGGDSHDKTWEYIIKNHADEIRNTDVLLAPHHGRGSGRNYDFLKTVSPKVTLFGNASSNHLDYNAYPEHRITNNQAGYIILDISEENLKIYVENKEFANDYRKNPKRGWDETSYSKQHNAYFLFRYPA